MHPKYAQNIRMPERAEDLVLSLERSDRGGVLPRLGRQHLDRNLYIIDSIAREPNFAAAADAESADEHEPGRQLPPILQHAASSKEVDRVTHRSLAAVARAPFARASAPKDRSRSRRVP